MTGQEWPLALAQLAHKAWKALVAVALGVLQNVIEKSIISPLDTKRPRI